jgi:hypothetical protein
MAQTRILPTPLPPESIVIAGDDPAAAIRLRVVIAFGSLRME